MSIASWLALPDDSFAVSIGMVEDEHGIIHFLCEVEMREPDDSGPNYSESLFCANIEAQVWKRFAGGKKVTCLGCLAEMGAMSE